MKMICKTTPTIVRIVRTAKPDVVEAIDQLAAVQSKSPIAIIGHGAITYFGV